MSKLYVHIIKRCEEEYELAGLSEDKQLWFSLPTEHRNLQEHKELLTISTIKSAIQAIKPINGYRKIGIKFDECLKKVYYDDDENLSYQDAPLEEINNEENGQSHDKYQDENFLIKRIQELELKLQQQNEFKLKDIEKKFLLEKFDKTQNPTEWITQFESECARYKMNESAHCIEALRFFVTASAKQWYESNLKKIGLTNWYEWKKSFLLVFIDKGWSTVRKAYTYKYLGGSLIDYALTKENLCLEIENDDVVLSRIHNIVMGLPIEIQNELDREKISTVDKLYTELRRLDGQYNKRFREKNQNENRTLVKKSNDIKFKKPCHICEALGWKNRFHLANECRNKMLYEKKRETNLTEAGSTSDIEAEMMKVEIDQKSLN